MCHNNITVLSEQYNFKQRYIMIAQALEKPTSYALRQESIILIHEYHAALPGGADLYEKNSNSCYRLSLKTTESESRVKLYLTRAIIVFVCKCPSLRPL